SGLCQWVFARLHPNFGIGIAKRWSKHSRAAKNKQEVFKDIKDEWLAAYSADLLNKEHYDYLIFGQRHLPLDIHLGESRYINLCEWLNYNSYGVFDGANLELKYFKNEKGN